MANDGIDRVILDEFLKESLVLVDECLELLESVEGDPSEVERLGEFANKIDRVMGGAKSLALLVSHEHPLHLIGDYCAICKSVGYQGASIQNNDQFYNIVVALLLDAVEMIKILFDKMDSSVTELKKIFSTTFLERLKWVSFQYDQQSKKAAAGQKMKQNEIDQLLAKLGL